MSTGTIYRAGGKRLLDVTGSAVGLVVLSPLFAVIALLVRMRMGSPVLFRQRRPGAGGQPFQLVKFRSMRAPGPGEGAQPDEVRLTRFGRWLRSTSLDELPELVNVLKGEMSLVGPRPLLMDYLPLYSADQARRHDVRPGITGWAQINGRNAVSWPDRFRLDTWYVDHVSLGLDLRILMMTVYRVVRREGVNQNGQATAERFLGNADQIQ